MSSTVATSDSFINPEFNGSKMTSSFFYDFSLLAEELGHDSVKQKQLHPLEERVADLWFASLAYLHNPSSLQKGPTAIVKALPFSDPALYHICHDWLSEQKRIAGATRTIESYFLTQAKQNGNTEAELDCFSQENNPVGFSETEKGLGNQLITMYQERYKTDSKTKATFSQKQWHTFIEKEVGPIVLLAADNQCLHRIHHFIAQGTLLKIEGTYRIEDVMRSVANHGRPSASTYHNSVVSQGIENRGVEGKRAAHLYFEIVRTLAHKSQFHESAWTPEQSFHSFETYLFQHGPLVVGGWVGQETYTIPQDPIVSQLPSELFCDVKNAGAYIELTHKLPPPLSEEIMGRKGSVIILIGAIEMEHKEIVLFIEPALLSDSRRFPPCTIFGISYADLLSSVADVDGNIGLHVQGHKPFALHSQADLKKICTHTVQVKEAMKAMGKAMGIFNMPLKAAFKEKSRFGKSALMDMEEHSAAISSPKAP